MDGENCACPVLEPVSAPIPAPVAPRVKPPRPDGFPLFAHGSGQWAKKVRGRLRYFGRWADPAAALKRWETQREDLLAGRVPRPVAPDELLLFELCNDFLAVKKIRLGEGELTEQSFREYLQACQRLCRVAGRETPVSRLAPEDFERLRADMRQHWGPVRIGTEIQRVRCVFKFGVDQGYFDRVPLYGVGFNKPTRKELRKHRAARGKRFFTAEQLRAILANAPPGLRAMTLLAINCGYGNWDVATITRRHLDLKAGWSDFPRPKTGIERRAKLWPETVKALRRLLRARDRRRKEQGAGSGEPAASTEQERRVARRCRRLVFLTKYLQRWRSGPRISAEFGRLLRRCGLKRPGLNFYALRHTFQTVANAARDRQAVAAIMGHAARSDDMADVYTEETGDDRLAAVAEHVRKWLFGEELRS